VSIAIAVWILVIVAGAGATANDSLLGVDNVGDVVTAVFLVAGVLSIAFLIYLKSFSGEWIKPDRSNRDYGVWVLVAIVIGLMFWQPDFLSSLAEEQAEEGVGGLFETAVEPESEEAVETVAQVTDILLLVGAVAVIGGVWFLVRRRTTGVPDDDNQPATALEIDMVQALDQAARELDATTDPRTAVLRSYAVLETVLATHGLTRAKAETATEHLQRAMQNLRIDTEAVAQLGGLYEIARFSERPISKNQQDAAATSLRRAQASLASLV
jgi:hypothetical protein